MITILKLVDGTEVAGEIEDETSNHIIMNNPLQINYRHTMSSSVPSVSFSRYMLFAGSENISFDKYHIMNRVEARAEFDGFYRTSIMQIKESLDPQIARDLADGDETIPTDKDQLYAAILNSLDPDNMISH